MLIRKKLFVAGILLFSIALDVMASLYWIARNVVMIGHDPSGHLVQTLKYAEILSVLSPQTLFKALTFENYRPPLIFIATQPFYWWFGISADSAQLLNVTLLALILILTFVLAKELVGELMALFAVLLTGFLPIMVAMTRLFYIENFLTAALLLSLLALMRSKEFQNRGWSLLWGASLGIALLVKWTTPIYVALPILFVLLRADFLREHQAAITHFHFDWHKGIWAVGTATLIVLLWYLPNRAQALQFPLGDALPVLWILLLACFIYLVIPPTTRLHNLWAGVLLALILASLWYLPRINFIYQLNDVAFGGDDGNDEVFSLLRWSNYTYNLYFLLFNHLGPLASLLSLPVAAWGWWRRSFVYHSASKGIVLCWLMLASTWLSLMFIAHGNIRYLTPVLPVLAILLADSLRAYPRKVAITFGTIWVVVFAIQVAIYTFDGLSDFQRRTGVLWVRPDYITQPASDFTDPGFAIAPDVIDTIGRFGAGPQSLGMLVNSSQIFRGWFDYLIDVEKHRIDLIPLTERNTNGWSDLLTTQWVLVKDGNNTGDVEKPGLQLIDRILGGDPLFHALYKEVKRYRLPDDETVFLYHRATEPSNRTAILAKLDETQVLADIIRKFWSNTAELIFANPELAVWVGAHDPATERITVLGSNEPVPTPQLRALYGTLFVVLGPHTETLQRWFEQNAYLALDAGDDFASVHIYDRPRTPLVNLAINAQWEHVWITALKSLPALRPGQVLPLEITTTGQVDGSLKVSLRLVNSTGKVQSTIDKVLTAQIRAGLLIPPTATPGTYAIVAVVYDPETLKPVLDHKHNSQTQLATISVGE